MVRPGDTYVLELQATKGTHAWTRADGGYSRGAAILQGVVEPAFDFSLQTYSQAVMEVPIDIKPGSFPNSINPRSRENILVAILTTGAFDATTVDPTMVLFGQTGTEATGVYAALEDVDGDGDTDMILHFNTQDTGIECGDTSASLTVETVGGQAIQGTDSINTVGCR